MTHLFLFFFAALQVRRKFFGEKVVVSFPPGKRAGRAGWCWLGCFRDKGGGEAEESGTHLYVLEPVSVRSELLPQRKRQLGHG